MPLEKTIDSLYVVPVHSEEEFEKLYQICVKHNIKFPKSIYKEKNLNCLYALDREWLGYTGTVIAMHTKDDHIIHDLNLLDQLLADPNNLK